MPLFQPGFRLLDGGEIGAAIAGSANIPPCGFSWYVGGPQANARTIADALRMATPGSIVWVTPQPTPYFENLVMSTPGVTLACAGPPKSVMVQAPVGSTNPVLTVAAPNCALVGMDMIGAQGWNGTLIVGDAFKARWCKFECFNNIGVAMRWQSNGVPGTTASLMELEDCEFAWATAGIRVDPSASQATQNAVRRGWFQNLSDSSIDETAQNSVQNLCVQDCVFDVMADGTVPGQFFGMNFNATNGNTGIVSGCRFPVALLSAGKNTVSTALIWSGNFHTGGISNNQPT